LDRAAIGSRRDPVLGSPAVRRRLLAWFRREKRQLPWRGTGDPYRVWVSEVMLQQTTVGAVLGRYEAFLRRFPDIGTLARASEQSVLAQWSGLGYYARARHLHRAARTILCDHGGRLPREAAALRCLPGFGDYMAAAVAAIAFGSRVPAADANVTRVLSRLFAIEGLAGTRAHATAVRARMAELLRRGRPSDLTAAVMDLGQLVCTPRAPACGACPLAKDCAALSRGSVGRFPRKRARPATSRVFVAAACIVRGRTAMLIQKDSALLRGLWQFPAAEGASPADAARRLRRDLALLGAAVSPGAAPVVTRHTIVHRHLEIAVYRAVAAPVAGSAERKSECVRWLTSGQLSKAAIPTLTRKIAAASGFLPRRGHRILVGDESRRVAASDRGSR
jgi:A/G-specific adenine glycosylase